MKLYNTLSRKIEEFVPLKPGNVRMYVCGITPYDTTHLGHAFTYVSFDVLVRYFKFKNYKVTYTQNVTDINDRDNDILKRAKEQNISWEYVANYWTKRFLDDMKKLNWIMPTNYLKASEHLETMIKLISALLTKGYAYNTAGSVYLDITKVKDFGKLSKLSKKEMIKVAKEFDEDLTNSNKKHPLDITLWRSKEPNQPSHIPSFDSPFGKGRPGWHIECSAMAICSLGEQIDIHGGGRDLIFPHHESEIAQSEAATGKIPFAKFWVHTGQVSYLGQKMSKSIGNLVLGSDLLKNYSPNEIRWMLLLNHYRKDWEFTQAQMQKAKDDIAIIEQATKQKEGNGNNHISQFLSVIENDLDTPKAQQILLSWAVEINKEKKKNKTFDQALKILGIETKK